MVPVLQVRIFVSITWLPDLHVQAVGFTLEPALGMDAVTHLQLMATAARGVGHGTEVGHQEVGDLALIFHEQDLDHVRGGWAQVLVRGQAYCVMPSGQTVEAVIPGCIGDGHHHGHFWIWLRTAVQHDVHARHSHFLVVPNAVLVQVIPDGAADGAGHTGITHHHPGNEADGHARLDAELNSARQALFTGRPHGIGVLDGDTVRH